MAWRSCRGSRRAGKGRRRSRREEMEVMRSPAVACSLWWRESVRRPEGGRSSERRRREGRVGERRRERQREVERQKRSSSPLLILSCCTPTGPTRSDHIVSVLQSPVTT